MALAEPKPRPVCVHCHQTIDYGEDYYITQPMGEPPYDRVHARCLAKLQQAVKA